MTEIVVPAGRAFTRRSVLQGMGFTALAALLGPGLISPGTALAASPRSRPRTALGGSYLPPGPLQLQASSQLSQDCFLTTDVLIGTNDRVMPFLNPYSKGVEAIIFTTGALTHLYRDPGQPSGWAYDAVDLQGLLTTVTDAAVAGNGSELYLLVFGSPDESSGNDDPAFLTNLTGASSWSAGIPLSYDDLSYGDLEFGADEGVGPVKGGISPDGSMCFFYALVDFPGAPTVVSWVATGDEGPGLEFQQGKTLGESTTITDYLMLMDSSTAGAGDGTWNGYLILLDSAGDTAVYNQIAAAGSSPGTDLYSFDPNDDLGNDGVSALLWAWTANGSTTGVPGYAVQTSSGLAFTDPNGNYNVLSAQNALTANETAVWLQDDLYTVNMLDSDGAVLTIQEISGDGTGTWSMPIPVTTTQNQGFDAIYGVPTDPTQSTLFAVGADESLSALTLGTAGWSQVLIKQHCATLEEIDSYRVQISVLDSNSAPAPLASVQVGTDRLVGVWQPEGSTIITPSAAVTMTTDPRGQLTFSVPAEELDTAVLTAQALDGNGNASGNPLQVIADYDVRAFLQGTGTLTHLGTLTGTSLTTATDSTGNLVFPALTNQPDAATQCVTALGQIITAGLGKPPPSNGVQSTLIDTSSGTPVLNRVPTRPSTRHRREPRPATRSSTCSTPSVTPCDTQPRS